MQGKTTNNGEKKPLVDGFKNSVSIIENFSHKLSTIPEQVFEILYRVTDTKEAINTILGLLGEVNHVSRVYIFEDTEDHKFCCNTFEWCAEGITPQIQNLSRLSYVKDLGGSYFKNFDNRGVFFCPDISLLPYPQYHMLQKQGIFSMLQSAILENGEFKGYIGFDECSKKRRWTHRQRQCLFLTSKIIGTFLCKMRREEALRETNNKLETSLERLNFEHMQLQESERRFQLILDNTQVSVWDYNVKSKTIIQTDSSQREHGFGRVIENVPESLIASGFVHPESVEAYRSIFARLDEGEQHVDGVVRLQTADRSGWWYEKVQYYSLPDEQGRPYKAIAIGSDITTTKAEQNQLQTVIDSVPSGIGIFEIVDNRMAVKYLNNGFYEMLQYKRENRGNYFGYNFMNSVYPEDLPEVKAVVDGLLNGEKSIDVKYRVINGNGKYTWTRVIGNRQTDANGNELIYCSFLNVQNTMNTLLELKRNQTLLAAALRNAKADTWEFDLKEHRAVFTDVSQRYNNVGQIIENLPESAIESGFVHPESADDYRRLFSGEFPNKEPVQYDIQIKNPKGSGYLWNRYILSPIYGVDGKLITSLGTTIDVTEQKRLQELFEKQIDELEQMDSENLIVKACYNLSKNIMQYQHRKADFALESKKLYDYDSSLYGTAALISDEEERKQFIKLFDREELLNNYDPENSMISFEYHRRRYNNQIFYAMIQSKLFSDPSTGDIMCFVSSYDITVQKTTQQMIDAVVSLDYDYLALLDCRTSEFTIYSNRDSSSSPLPPQHSYDYENEVLLYIQKYLVEDEAACSIRDMSIDNIRLQLKNSDRFLCYDNIKEADGTVSRKMLQFSYLDKGNEKVLITRVDVTDVYQREQQKIDELQAAKNAAERSKLEAEEATRVKTKFFSQMSHDLRTPLNAVIGLTELAKDETADEEAIKRYLSNINDSGQFLLTLVNEGLDIEKIAANKMQLNASAYTCAQLRKTITDMIEPLCIKKGITLVIDYNCNKYTVNIDHIRFEQIIINLLSNAVKFTPAGGRVEFSIQNKNYQNHQMSCDFVIRDNGIGMSPEFQRVMFDPFSQESNNHAAQMQGTGLGLSIVKSLVDLMGGTISVKSKLGEGTEFTVHLVMPVIDEKDTAHSEALPAHDAAALDGKHILVVEDHPLNTEIAKKLLQKRGVIVTCAADGQEGINDFRSSAEGEYFAILMDIHMPIKDGLEAAREIRSMARSDAKTVPIIAMSANSFEQDAQESLGAGMNRHLSKPIDTQKLYEVLESFI